MSSDGDHINFVPVSRVGISILFNANDLKPILYWKNVTFLCYA